MPVVFGKCYGIDTGFAELLIMGETMRLHPKQEIAINVENTAVVSAGAGSGKTTVLALRYCRLIASGQATVDSLLTLTFTRKAAAEMHERIRGVLKIAAAEEDRDGIERERLKEALLGFSRARITTLDSFCGKVLREAARFYGVTPEFSTDEAQVRRLMKQECMRFIASKKDEPAMQVWLRDYGVSGVLEGALLPLSLNHFSMVKPICWQNKLNDQASKMTDEARALLARLADDSAACCNGEPCTMKFVGQLRELLTAPLPDFNDYSEAGLSAITDFAERVGSIARRGQVSDANRMAADQAKELIQFCKDLVPLAVNALRIAEYVRGLGPLCDELQAAVAERKRNSGLLGFSDVASLALHVLMEQPDVRDEYAERISHIMIDEFQDNNQLQQDFLFCLALKDEWQGKVLSKPPVLEDIRNDRLFFVGDEKQSIFAFRGADVAVFRTLAQSVGRHGGKAIDLSVNYRSHPELIVLFNQLFPRVFGEAPQSFEAAYSPLEPRPVENHGAFEVESTAARAEFWVWDADQENEDGVAYKGMAESEADFLADWLAAKIGGGMLEIGDGQQSRPAEYSDCAILLRNGGSVMHFEQALRERGIPYVSLIMRSLFLEAPANDLYSFLQLSVYPEDRTAYATVLRSPFIGLDDISLTALLLEREVEVFPDDSCLSAMGLSAEAMAKMQQGREILASLTELRGRSDAAELLDFLWYDCGYRWFLLCQPENHGYLEHYEYLREWCRPYKKDLVPMLAELRRHLGEAVKYEGEDIVRESGNAVTIMSVHASKGLGFPVVLLAQAGQKSGGDSGLRPLASIAGEPVFMLSAPGFASRNRTSLLLHQAKEEKKQREEAELKRLLYVAATRVKDYLVISGIKLNKKKANDEDVVHSTFSSLLLAATGLEKDDFAEGWQELCHDIGPARIAIRRIPASEETISAGRNAQVDLDEALVVLQSNSREPLIPGTGLC
ncbi:MAG: hypothetical protein D6B26_06605, partial [Spirochaetaceae bacterium]